MTFRAWQFAVVVLLFAVVSASASIVYTNVAARQAEQQLCGVVLALDEAYRATPPQTPAGQRIADSIAELRRDFGC